MSQRISIVAGSLFALIVMSFSSGALAGGDCTYSADTNDIKLQWTAFKYTEKTGVNGTFNTTKVTGATSAGSLADLVGGLKMEIDASSIESNNPGRNVTIAQFFFAKFAPASAISASVKGLKGDDAKGELLIDIAMNGVTKTLPFAYTASADGTFEGRATMDMMDFGLKAAFESIHSACKNQHMGKDGVAKTWPVVDLQVTAKFSKVCK